MSPRNAYTADIQRIAEQMNDGLPLPIDPANIDSIRAHLRGEHDDPFSPHFFLRRKGA